MKSSKSKQPAPGRSLLTGIIFPKRPKFDPILRDELGNQITETKEAHKARFANYLEAHKAFDTEWKKVAAEHRARLLGQLPLIK